MIKWTAKTMVVFLIVLLSVYGCVYGTDYITFEEWQPEWTTLNGDPLTSPLDLSEKTFVYLMWTDSRCEYCVAQLRALYEFMDTQGIPETDFDIILVYQEAPTGADPQVLAVIGPPRMGVPYTQFWVHEQTGWVMHLEWDGYYTVASINKLFEEAQNETEVRTQPEA